MRKIISDKSEYLLTTQTKKGEINCVSELIEFWNKKVRPKLSNFFKNPQLLSIIDELDHQIEKFENQISIPHSPPKNLFKQKSVSNLLSSTKKIKNAFVPLDSSLIIKEEDDNAVITNLKNNSLSSPTFNDETEVENDNIIYNNKGYIKYITIDLLIKKIANDEPICENEERYKNLIEGIVIQYPMFINKDILISKLISAFNYFYSKYTNSTEYIELNGGNNIMIKPKIPYKLVNFIYTFIKVHFDNDIYTLSKENIKKFLEFFEMILNIYDIKNNMENEIKEVIQMLNVMKNVQKGTSHQRSLTKITDTMNVRGESFDINDYTEESIAKELTRITYYLFSKIEYKEFFGAKFTKKEKNKTSPNIIEAVNKFNNLSFFVIEEILSYDHKNQRGEVAGKFIKIADELRKLNNFNDCMSVIAGLNHVISQKLKKTWKCVSTVNITLFNSIRKFLSFEDNYKFLREQEKKCIQSRKPFIPFLGFYTKRVCFVEEQGRYLKNGILLNLDKIIDFYGNLKNFFIFKENNYIIGKQKDLNILQCLKPSTEAELESLAERLEPSFILASKRLMDKRDTNTDKVYKKITNGFTSNAKFI